MNKTMFILGIITLLLSAVLFIFDLDYFGGLVGNVNVNIYIGWFFALLGALLLITAIWKRTITE